MEAVRNHPFFQERTRRWVNDERTCWAEPDEIPSRNGIAEKKMSTASDGSDDSGFDGKKMSSGSEGSGPRYPSTSSFRGDVDAACPDSYVAEYIERVGLRSSHKSKTYNGRLSLTSSKVVRLYLGKALQQESIALPTLSSVILQGPFNPHPRQAPSGLLPAEATIIHLTSGDCMLYVSMDEIKASLVENKLCSSAAGDAMVESMCHVKPGLEKLITDAQQQCKRPGSGKKHPLVAVVVPNDKDQEDLVALLQQDKKRADVDFSSKEDFLLPIDCQCPTMEKKDSAHMSTEKKRSLRRRKTGASEVKPPENFDDFLRNVSIDRIRRSSVDQQNARSSFCQPTFDSSFMRHLRPRQSLWCPGSPIIKMPTTKMATADNRHLGVRIGEREATLAAMFNDSLQVQFTVTVLPQARTLQQNMQVVVSVRNLIPEKGITFSVRCYSLRCPQSPQMVYPVTGMEYVSKGGQWWDRRVELYNVQEGDWCVFECFCITAGFEQLWCVQRAVIKVPGDIEAVLEEDEQSVIEAPPQEVVGATIATIYDELQRRRNDEAEALVFAALQLHTFQHLPVRAFLFAALATVSARRNDAKTALNFTRAILKLRQAGGSSVDEPNIWMLVESLQSEIRVVGQEEVRSPIGPLYELFNYPRHRDLTEPLQRSMQQILVKKSGCGQAVFSDSQVLVYASHDAKDGLGVSVTLYSVEDVSRRLIARGFGQIVRLLLLVDIEESAQNRRRQGHLEKVLIDSTISRDIIKMSQEEATMLTRNLRLVVWDNEVDQWIDMTSETDHVVKIDAELVTVQTPVYPSMAVLLVDSSPGEISTSVVQSLGLPLEVGDIVYFQVVDLLAARPFHECEHQLALRCFPVDATKPEKAKRVNGEAVLGESPAVRLTAGTMIHFRLEGNIKGSSAYCQQSLTSDPVRFLGKCGHKHQDTPFLQHEMWIETSNAIRGKAFVVLGMPSEKKSTLVSFNICERAPSGGVHL